MRPPRRPVSASIWRDQDGSAMAEYALIASLLAALATLLATYLGGELLTWVHAIRDGLASLRPDFSGRP